MRYLNALNYGSNSATTVLWPGRLGLQNTLTACLLRSKSPPNKCPGYDTKQSDGEALVMLELWGMRSTPLLPSLPCPLQPGVVAPDRAHSKLNWLYRTKKCTYPKLNCLKLKLFFTFKLST